MTPLERVCEAYWEAFRDGFLRVGGKDYPHWSQGHAEVKAETMRCMRHAMEVIRGDYEDYGRGDGPAWGKIFPEPLAKRGQPLTTQDEVMAEKIRG